jgi:hypothetical protein
MCNALPFVFMEILVRWQGDTLFLVQVQSETVYGDIEDRYKEGE